MKIATVLGARPQFIKAAPLSAELGKAGIDEVLVHAGQHFDAEMSARFFEELNLPEPACSFPPALGSHAEQTAAMLVHLEGALRALRPDWVLVHGDTNSSLAGALAAAKLGIRVAHVEAGMRCGDWKLPEEINRRVIDRLSRLFFCSCERAEARLRSEGLRDGIHRVGDVLLDALQAALGSESYRAQRLEDLELEPSAYLLATVHRAGNTDSSEPLRAVLECLESSPLPVVWPIHPRTAKALEEQNLSLPANVRRFKPFGYHRLLRAASSAAAIATDSGGLQKEAFWLGVPCLTLRESTEWVETVECGWNRLVGTSAARFHAALEAPWPKAKPPDPYGDGRAAARIAGVFKAIASGGE